MERGRIPEGAAARPGGPHPGLAGWGLALVLALVLALASTAPIEAGVGLPEIASIRIGPHSVHLLNDSRGLRQGSNTLTVHVPDLPPGHGVTVRLHGPQGEVVEVPLRPLRVLGDPGAGPGPPAAGTAGDASVDRGAPAPAEDVPAHVHGATDHGAPTPGSAAPAGDAHGGPQPGGHAHGGPPPAPGAHGHAAHGDAAHGSPSPDEHAPAVTDHDATAGEEAPAHGHAPHGAGHGGVALAGYAVRGTVRLPSPGAWRAVVALGDGQGEPLTGEIRLEVTADGPNPLYLGLLGLLTGGSVLFGVIQRGRGEGRS